MEIIGSKECLHQAGLRKLRLPLHGEYETRRRPVTVGSSLQLQARPSRRMGDAVPSSGDSLNFAVLHGTAFCDDVVPQLFKV